MNQLYVMSVTRCAVYQSTRAGFFRPTPIPVVATEDPAPSAGPATKTDQLLNPDTTNPDFKTKVVILLTCMLN